MAENARESVVVERRTRPWHQEALAIRRVLARARPEIYWPLLATTLNNLGTIYYAMHDLEAALGSFEETLAIQRELARARAEVYQPLIARSLTNLGSVHSALNNLGAARASHEGALTIWRKLAAGRPEVYRAEVAMTVNNLGTIQSALSEWEAARASHEEALAILRELAEARPETYRPDVAATLSNLGTIYAAMNKLAEARSSFEETGRLYEANAATRPTARLAERQTCWTNLGALLRQESLPLGWPDYRAARAALRQASHCAEQFRDCFADPAQRKRVQAESIGVYDLLARTCLDLWDLSCREGRPDRDRLREAVETAEAGRARQLLDLLADEVLIPNLPPAKVELAGKWPGIRRQFLQAGRWLQQQEEREADGGEGTVAGERAGMGQEREAWRLVRRAPAECFAYPGSRGFASASQAPVAIPASSRTEAGARETFERLRQEHDAALVDIRRFHPEFDPDHPVVPVNLTEMQKQVPTDVPTALVQFTLDQEGGFALIVTREQVRALRLPGLTAAWAQAHATAWFKGYNSRLEKVPAQLEAEAPHESWGEIITRLLEPVAARVVRPVLQALADTGLERLVLAPHRALHVFPLHVCEIGDGRYLGDAFEILFPPSLSIWHRCASRLREKAQEVLLIQNPTSDVDLHFTDMEGAGVARRFQPHVRTYRGLAAQKEALLQQGRSSQVWHYCGHARFYSAQPLQSALMPGGPDVEVFGEQWLTLRDMFTRLHLPHNSLSALNGCESGMLVPEAADDYVSLPTGFLYAGAQCVISTLWSVNDLSSALVMEKFYALWRGDNGIRPLAPSAALREAVRWLREDIRSGRQVARELLPPLLAWVADSKVRARCEAAARQLEYRYPDRPPFASPAHWAPFICSGVGYPLHREQTEPG